MSAPCPILGFIVNIQPGAGVTEADRDALVQDLGALLDRNDLSADGGRRGLEYVIRRDGSQATNEDRMILLEWAARWNARAAIAVGDLIDLNQAG